MSLKLRLRALGITGRALAQRLGVEEATMSRNLAREPPYRGYAAWLDALEVMTPEQRAMWLARAR